MIYDVSVWAIVIFLIFVAAVLGLSFYFGAKTKSAASYYAAGGNIHWGVNGVAFAGDYLSAASFLGISGMIAYAGFDGFIYSVGYLAGWVVALFLVAEPLKRLGKYTFTDALDAKFNSRAIKLTASISTLIVSIFYLIPQMVGAGDLVVPLLGLPHWAGVTIVGAIVIYIVATAGMTSTTFVQFIKGALLIIFATILTGYILNNGFSLKPTEDYHQFAEIPATLSNDQVIAIESEQFYISGQIKHGDEVFVILNDGSYDTWFRLTTSETGTPILSEALSITLTAEGERLYNGAPKSEERFYQVGHMSKIIYRGEEVEETGPLGPFEFLSVLEESEVVIFKRTIFDFEGDRVTVFYQQPTAGTSVLKPGLMLKVGDDGTFWDKINFLSLMLALFFGTSALPHILIRYYTVPSQRAARKSTIVAIAAIGFFYILTLYLGLGSMVGGVNDLESSNMSSPLLAKSFGVGIFSIISAIAFATVLGTVSGLIVASSGAIAHDFVDMYLKVQMTDRQKVKAGKLAAFGVGIFAIILGILFQGMNVSFLVGLAFAVAASANLPSILAVIFWSKTTSRGIAASIVTGIISSVTIILLSPSMFERYGLLPENAPIPFDNPGIISIPLSFAMVVVVSLLTQKKEKAKVFSI
ncbi:MAG: cation acetate symporter [Bacteroidetes bacterium]|nr:MAG: cation acetate symporter [Bacteroidota bacterium]